MGRGSGVAIRHSGARCGREAAEGGAERAFRQAQEWAQRFVAEPDRAVLFDLDGVLEAGGGAANTRAIRLEACLHALYSGGTVFVSSRPESERAAIEAWLREQVGRDPGTYRLELRPPTSEEPADDLRLRLIAESRDAGPRIDLVVSASHSLVEALRTRGIATSLEFNAPSEEPGLPRPDLGEVRPPVGASPAFAEAVEWAKRRCGAAGHVIVWDIDGVLSDAAPRAARWIVRKGSDGRVTVLDQETHPTEWEHFLRECAFDAEIRPGLALEAALHLAYPDRVIFMTGRNEFCRAESLGWLREHVLVGRDPSTYRLVMKPDDWEGGDPDFKVAACRELAIEGLIVDFVIDDSNANIAALRAAGVPHIQFRLPGGNVNAAVLGRRRA